MQTASCKIFPSFLFNSAFKTIIPQFGESVSVRGVSSENDNKKRFWFNLHWHVSNLSVFIFRKPKERFRKVEKVFSGNFHSTLWFIYWIYVDDNEFKIIFIRWNFIRIYLPPTCNFRHQNFNQNLISIFFSNYHSNSSHIKPTLLRFATKLNY